MLEMKKTNCLQRGNSISNGFGNSRVRFQLRLGKNSVKLFKILSNST